MTSPKVASLLAIAAAFANQPRYVSEYERRMVENADKQKSAQQLALEKKQRVREQIRARRALKESK